MVHGAADVADHQRRQPGPAGRVGDGRRPAARRPVALRLRRAAVLVGLAPRARLRDRRADRRLSARPAGPARAPQHPPQPGSHRAPLAHRRRSLHRPSHRQGLRRGGAREPALQARLRAPLPHQPEDHEHGRRAAAADGAARRAGGGWPDLVRQRRDFAGADDAGELPGVHLRGLHDVHADQEAEPREHEPAAGDGGLRADLHDARHAHRGRGAAGRTAAEADPRQRRVPERRVRVRRRPREIRAARRVVLRRRAGSWSRSSGSAARGRRRCST